MGKIKEIIKEKKFKYICFFWSIISIQFILGGNLQGKGHIFENEQQLLIDVLRFIFMTIVFIMLHYCILELFKKIKTEEHKKIKNNNIRKIKVKNKFLKNAIAKIMGIKRKEIIYFLIIFVCWIPTVLAFYPAIIAYDGGDQIARYFFLGQLKHHPILITKLYTTFYIFGIMIDSPTIGMFFFSLFQMTFMAFVFSNAVKFVEEQTEKKWIRNLSIIFYALYPYNQLFSITTTKDVIYAGLALIFLINLYRNLEDKFKVTDYIFLIIIGVLMLLSRNNSIYMLEVSLPFIIIALIKDKYKVIKIVSVFLIIIVTYKAANSFLYMKNKSESLDAVSDEENMRMILFIQAVGRTVSDNKDRLTDEEKEKISYYFTDYEKIGEKYSKNIADSASKFYNKNAEKDKKEFIKFIIDLGKKYPMSYIESLLDTTRGYWYIYDESFSEIMMYKHPGAFELYDFGIARGEFRVVHDSKMPILKYLYTELYCSNLYQVMPVIHVFLQPGIYFYFTLAFLLYAIYKNEKNTLTIAILLFVFYASCYMAACSIIRYMYPVMVSTPIMLALVEKNKKEEENE